MIAVLLLVLSGSVLGDEVTINGDTYEVYNKEISCGSGASQVEYSLSGEYPSIDCVISESQVIDTKSHYDDAYIKFNSLTIDSGVTLWFVSSSTLVADSGDDAPDDDCNRNSYAGGTSIGDGGDGGNGIGPDDDAGASGGGGAGGSRKEKGGDGGDGGDDIDVDQAGHGATGPTYSGTYISLNLTEFLQVEGILSSSGENGKIGDHGDDDKCCWWQDRGCGAGGGSGGSGAGEIYIETETISGVGSIIANGGDGGDGEYGGQDSSSNKDSCPSGAGGGGAGGIINIIYQYGSLPTSLSVAPGLGGAPGSLNECDRDPAPAKGKDGSYGAINNNVLVENTLDLCNDGINNDFDSFIDMQDPDCYNSPTATNISGVCINNFNGPLTTESDFENNPYPYCSALNGSDGCCGDDVLKSFECEGEENIGAYCSYFLFNEDVCLAFNDYCWWEEAGAVSYCSPNIAGPNFISCYNLNSEQCSIFSNIVNPSTGNSFCNNVVNSFNYNDLYYTDDTSQYMCSINSTDTASPEKMKLNFSQDETYFQSREWNWLDAWDSDNFYIIHNAQLPDHNAEYMSNDDAFYVCNASGLADELNFDADHSVDEFGTVPMGDDVGSCPYGTYYCGCAALNDTEVREGGGYGGCTGPSSQLNYSCLSFNDADCGTYGGTNFVNLVFQYPLTPYAECVAHPCFCQDYASRYPGECDYAFWQDWIGGDIDLPSPSPNSFEQIKQLATDVYLYDLLHNHIISLRNESNCSNGIDDDGDRFMDCEDWDCSDDPLCEDYPYPVDNCTGDNGMILCNLTYCAMSYSECLGYYAGSGYYVALKNESFLCYERSNNALFTQCCGQTTFCENAEYQDKFSTYTNLYVDYQTEFVGNGVSLFTINTFDKESNNSLFRNYTDLVPIVIVRGNNLASRKYSISQNFYKPNIDLEDISNDYYKSLEFDIGFSNIQNLLINFSYFNSTSGNNETFDIHESDFVNYSNNGDQGYRWHHVVIPLLDGMDRYNYLYIELNENEYFAIDNIFLKTNKTNSDHDYMCVGDFGFWIDEFDPKQATGNSCKDIYPSPPNGDGLTACELVNDDGKMLALANDANNFSWMEFDPFRLVCDSYLSYGWTGTKCCGDDSDIHEKEYYSDYRGACWNGFNVFYNQRIGDVLYDVDDVANKDKRNQLNRFLFYSPTIADENKFWGCNITSDNIIIKNSSVVNGVYNNLYNISFSTSDIGGQINITKADFCTIKGKYYCNYDNTWDDFIDSEGNTLNWSEDLNLFEKSDSYNNSQGCCPSDYCWNGNACVRATFYEYNSSRLPFDNINIINNQVPEHINFRDLSKTKGYRCVISNNSGIAVWENATVKYDWNLEKTGYCKQESYCFVSEDFEFTSSDKTNLGIPINNDGCCDMNSSGPDSGENVTPILNVGNSELLGDCIFNGFNYFNVSDSACLLKNCVPSKISLDKSSNIVEFGYYYCNNGSWSSRVSMVAKKLYNYFNDETEDFSFACDDELIINFAEDSLLAKVSNFCVYNDSDIVAVSYILEDISPEDFANIYLLQSIYKDEFFINPSQTLSDVNISCNHIPFSNFDPNLIHCEFTNSVLNDSNKIEQFYYDTKLNALIVTSKGKSAFSPPSSSWSNFINGLRNLIYGIFHPGYNFDFFSLQGNTVYDKLYMSRNSDLQILAAQEHKYDELFEKVSNKTFINYSDEFNFENVLNTTYALALFEQGIIIDKYFADEFIFSRCSDNGYLLIKEPSLELRIKNKNRDDMLWTYLTKTLRLTDVFKENNVITGELCTYCTDHANCDSGMVCEGNKCKGNASFEGCYFDNECYDSLVCVNNVCSENTCNNEHVGYGEECDLGAGINGNLTEQYNPSLIRTGQIFEFCNASCEYEEYTARCNDTYINKDEDCDDGNFDNNDSCLDDCTVAYCGDGYVNADEDCEFTANCSGAGEICNSSCGCEIDCSSFTALINCGGNGCYWCERCNSDSKINTFSVGKCVEDLVDCIYDSCNSSICGATCEIDTDCLNHCDLTSHTENISKCDSTNCNCDISGDTTGDYCDNCAHCGDGDVNCGEECDDGNTNNTDDCSNVCEIVHHCTGTPNPCDTRSISNCDEEDNEGCYIQNPECSGSGLSYRNINTDNHVCINCAFPKFPCGNSAACDPSQPWSDGPPCRIISGTCQARCEPCSYLPDCERIPGPGPGIQENCCYLRWHNTNCGLNDCCEGSCTFSSDGCAGTAYECSHYNTGDTCNKANGCGWS